MINACGEFPCLNGGTCNPVGTDNFTCSCPFGVMGDYCENDTFDGCLAKPCLNGGTCTVSFTCRGIVYKFLSRLEPDYRFVCVSVLML